jgi:Ser/Thr protein kinase RdoA (MazF antagonist)
MGIFTKLTTDDIARLTANFPALPRTTFKSQGIALGTVNTYYRLCYKTGETYYLKIDEVAEELRLKNEIRIFENLNAHVEHLSFTVPYPLETAKGKKHVPFRKKFALILPEIKGASFFGKKLTPKRLALIGHAMSEWHNLPIDSRIHEHRFCLRGQKTVYKEIQSKLIRKHPKLCRFISDQLVQLEKNAPQREKLTLIHADLFAENILWRNGH